MGGAVVAGGAGLSALGGIVGPVVFVAAWAVLGASTEGYAPARDAISELAADGAPGQWAMTAAFVVLGVGLAHFGRSLRRALRPLAGTSAIVAGAATVGVAAFPLGSPFRDRVHDQFATVAYVALAAAPLLAVRPHVAARRWRLAAFAAAAALVTFGSALGFRAGPSFGLWQRIGLTATHAWVVATAVRIVRPGERQLPL